MAAASNGLRAAECIGAYVAEGALLIIPLRWHAGTGFSGSWVPKPDFLACSAEFDKVGLRAFGVAFHHLSPDAQRAQPFRARADFDRHESRGDSQWSESLIQNAGWGMEASMHGSASLDGFAHAAFGRD